MDVRGGDPNRLAHFILRNVGRAVRRYGMLLDGDRVAVAVSGGKDSLALLDLLTRLRPVWKTRFELNAVHVTGDASGILAPHPPLIDWLASRNVPYRVVAPELSESDVAPLTCQRCTWLRRKALFDAAEALGCNVLAYAHHADDVAQTTLMNLLYVGSVNTLAPVGDYFDGHFRLIRPLIYTAESELLRFAAASGFPAQPPACSRSGDSRRALVAAMLKMLGRDYPRQARANLAKVGLGERNIS